MPKFCVYVVPVLLQDQITSTTDDDGRVGPSSAMVKIFLELTSSLSRRLLPPMSNRHTIITTILFFQKSSQEKTIKASGTQPKKTRLFHCTRVKETICFNFVTQEKKMNLFSCRGKWFAKHERARTRFMPHTQLFYATGGVRVVGESTSGERTADGDRAGERDTQAADRTVLASASNR